MARRAKFHYNQETLSFEKIELTFFALVKKVAVYLFTSLCGGFIAFLIFILFLESPQEKQLKKENIHMQAQYDLLQEQMNELQSLLTDLQQRDDNLYRVIFQADPILSEVRHRQMGNDQRYQALQNMSNSKIMVDITKQMDDLKRQTYIQFKSYDELIMLAKQNEQKLLCIPAIQPIYNKDLTRVASGYGMRIDPIYRTRKMHQGMDFTAPIGTEIFATGNGIVKEAGWRQGYGKCVKINHGFGYETLYAHMHKITARVGQSVKRGDVIGEVGNTGKSTGPHLHYEVHFKGTPVNPQNYYFLDLSPEEYDIMLQLSQNAGQVFD
ncbi:MAG: M23 family metallopeptidase [Paludibacteraceae bacterium]|nr:M23 family metallopeptidase [Paludibacteraceae bacterium]MDI9536707.1 M23 family metallopeptidase [Bacteroidota bacterium]HHT61019.1 M23 family metallopeptidase [Bacteroidales bacterium]MBP9038969.1 M23 family metallopeptidase [Paludibacteraceae bacterium]HPB84768.1 M23 family metallopeptidase [Paludibacteraceae bacterium]